MFFSQMNNKNIFGGGRSVEENYSPLENKRAMPFFPTTLYGADAWGMRSAERRKVNVPEIKCLISFIEVLTYMINEQLMVNK